MTPYYTDDLVTLYHGDCLDVLRELPDASVDSVVTDPPYELTAGKKGGSGVASVNLSTPFGRSRVGTGNGGGFMGKGWDATGIAHDPVMWAECLRVLKPGGHLLAFGGTRTWHRLAVAIEDAGFEIRDSIAFMFGSGFPKSLDVSKAIDKDAENTTGTPDAARWQGWGTALKPAHEPIVWARKPVSAATGAAVSGTAFEPIVVARKPLAGTVAANVLAHGTGALNIDGCRIKTEGEVLAVPQSDPHKRGAGAGEYGISTRDTARMHAAQAASIARTNTMGRWPANVVLDEHAAAEVDRQSGTSTSRIGKARGADAGDGWGMTATGAEYDDTGGASRFFYTTKAGSDERPSVNGVAHPTVKPLSLMRWLVRLVTPPGGVCVDPFAGSGTTAEACVIEGFRCITVEREAEYLPLIVSRLTKPIQPVLFDGGVA